MSCPGAVVTRQGAPDHRLSCGLAWACHCVCLFPCASSAALLRSTSTDTSRHEIYRRARGYCENYSTWSSEIPPTTLQRHSPNDFTFSLSRHACDSAFSTKFSAPAFVGQSQIARSPPRPSLDSNGRFPEFSSSRIVMYSCACPNFRPLWPYSVPARDRLFWATANG